jgi:hypothetical protein
VRDADVPVLEQEVTPRDDPRDRIGHDVGVVRARRGKVLSNLWTVIHRSGAESRPASVVVSVPY